ncbi:MAG: heme-binding protein [Erysipelotrichaceae bacterium]|nr:heme-binding protein [Erysipelotrichaceae bacterium]
MGINALMIVKERKLRRIGIRVKLDDKLVFQYLMDGKNEDNYLKGKENVVIKTGKSSMFVYDHQNDYQELLNDSNYCVSGGALPIMINGEIRGSISISGMTQELDHALAQEVLENAYQKSFTYFE